MLAEGLPSDDQLFTVQIEPVNMLLLWVEFNVVSSESIYAVENVVACKIGKLFH